MDREITRRWSRSGVLVASVHPELGPIDRGRVIPVRGRVEGAGAFGTWQVIDQDHVAQELLVVGDYLSAEGALLDATAWADEPAGPNDFNE